MSDRFDRREGNLCLEKGFYPISLSNIRTIRSERFQGGSPCWGFLREEFPLNRFGQSPRVLIIGNLVKGK